MLHVAVVHLDIGLGEEAEYLRQQVAFGIREVAVPILDIVGERHFLRQPVDTLLGQPGFVGPGIPERLIDGVFRKKIEPDRMLVGRAGNSVHIGPVPSREACATPNRRNAPFPPIVGRSHDGRNR